MINPSENLQVSIISVNYNEPEETREFLDSVYKSDFDSFEVIIVDNGSKRKVSKNLEHTFPRLTCIIHKENLGFAGGNNLGIKAAKGKYLLFLNNDTLVPKDFLKKMAGFMEKNPEIGIASPKINFTTGQIQYAGSSNLNALTGRGKRIGLYEEDNGQYDKNYETDLIHGAAMITRSKVIKEIGVMCEDYFLYYEELDWCMRIKRHGYKVYYVGTTNIIHKESISVGIGSPLKTYYMSRNRIMFQLKNSKGAYRFSAIVFYCSIGAMKMTLKYLFNGQFNHLKNLWRGMFWHINNKYVYKG